MWGCFLMSGVKILHFLKDWWKSIPIHQNYTMALNSSSLLHVWLCVLYLVIWFTGLGIVRVKGSSQEQAKVEQNKFEQNQNKTKMILIPQTTTKYNIKERPPFWILH